MCRTPSPQRRDGFTLVELLVVIAIIAILIALTSAAVLKAIGRGDELRIRNDISQLSTAIQAFKTEFSVPYLPSRFTIRTVYAPNDPDLIYLKKIWPRIGATNPTSGAVAVNWYALNAANGITLDGNQCLVLFLGGPDGFSGFSSSPTDPMRPATPGETRIGPFYEFTVDRLKVTGAPPARFVDPLGNPYVYFSAGPAGNDYPTIPVSVVNADGQTFNISPYRLSANPLRFANPNSFQIISAGRDGLYGPGNLSWAGATGGGATLEGYDDMANFYPTLLGVSQ